MILVKYSKIDVLSLVDTYKDNIKYIVPKAKDKDGNWMIELITNIRNLDSGNSLVIVDYSKELILSLKALQMDFKLLCPNKLVEDGNVEDIVELKELLELESEFDYIEYIDNIGFEQYLFNTFDWLYKQEETAEVEAIGTVETIALQENTKELINEQDDTVEDIQLVEAADGLHKSINKEKLTLKELIEQDMDITEADVRELKSLTNKFKVAMLLQAKSRLNTVLKLCGVLDKLYAELVTRIDSSLETSDTASLMYTADYVSKALSDTNQFIMSLITSEKLQNFFIIDNSNVINISNDRVDIDKREKIRKAAEIVMDNIDYFTSGQYENVVNPNQNA